MTEVISPGPTPPSTSDPASFDSRADALFVWIVEEQAPKTTIIAAQVSADAQTAADAAESVAESVSVAVQAAATVVSSASTQATSITSMAIGTGTKTFTLQQLNKAFSLGQVVNIVSTANRANRMVGYINDFTPGTGVMSVVVAAGGTFGSGTVAAWTISVGGAVGGAQACTEAELLAGVVTDKFIPPAILYAAQSPKTVAYASTITLDGNVGINFEILLTGNVIMANPVNFKPGQSGTIFAKQDGTGTRNITSWGNKFLKPTGTPADWLSDTAASLDGLAYFVRSDGMIALGLSKAYIAA